MASKSDDDFGLSSSDEAQLITALENKENGHYLKRKSDHELSSEAKKSRNDSKTSREAAIANKVLQERFRLNAFRLEQEGSITRLLQGDSAVVVFPTGRFLEYR